MGYVVIRAKRAMALGAENILWIDDVGTLFPTYESAKNAVRRTDRYSNRYEMSWNTHIGKMHIQRVELNYRGN